MGRFDLAFSESVTAGSGVDAGRMAAEQAVRLVVDAGHEKQYVGIETRTRLAKVQSPVRVNLPMPTVPFLPAPTIPLRAALPKLRRREKIAASRTRMFWLATANQWGSKPYDRLETEAV